MELDIKKLNESPLDYIQRIDKVEWIKGLQGTPDEKRAITQKILKSLIEFRLGLYLVGVDLGYETTQWLAALELITAPMRNAVADKHLNIIQQQYTNRFSIDKDGQVKGYFVPDEGTPEHYIFTSQKAEIDLREVTMFSSSAVERERFKGTRIHKIDWTIPDTFDIPNEIYDFVTNINKGFQHYKPCGLFDKYRMQAYMWLQEANNYNEGWSEDRKFDFLAKERARILENTLYAANKYLIYQDPDDMLVGEKKFTAWPAQEVLFYLMDINLSLIISKLRQIGFTTVIGGTEGIKTMLARNYYCKFVANKGKKSDELFRDKVKYAIQKTPYYLKPTIANFNASDAMFGYSYGKGGEITNASRFSVDAPSYDVINGGTPKKILCDEIGMMDEFDEIVAQGRPTMFKYDMVRDKWVMTKQLIAWGTGGKINKQGGAFAREKKAANEAWNDRFFRHGLVPLFINSFAKPGFSWPFYEAEKKFYYSKKKEAGKEDPRIVFHQSWPITEDDVFLMSSDTVISMTSINSSIERINSKIVNGKLKEVKGYFEPLFDTSRPRGDNAYIPYEIVGARFIPADQKMIDEGSPFSCVTILVPPDLSYENRYYKGTDPIFTSSGHSKLASAIWDSKEDKIPAYINFKSSDYRFEYLQSLLLNLYYSPEYGGRKLGIRELLEFNVGGEYYNFCQELGFGHIFTGNKMLPRNMQTSTIDIGINKRGTNSLLLVNRLEELMLDHINDIDILELFIQLKTFVKKETATGWKYEPENKKIHYDDLIDAVNYAKINADIHAHLMPKFVGVNERKEKEQKKLRYYYDNAFNLRLGYQNGSRQRNIRRA